MSYRSYRNGPFLVGQATRAAMPTAAPQNDIVAGRLVFRKCQVCHSLKACKKLLGPSLAGVLGRKAGTELAFEGDKLHIEAAPQPYANFGGRVMRGILVWQRDGTASE